MEYVSRAGEKLDYAISKFNINISGTVCADFGSNVGGFVGVLLDKGAKKVYSVDTSYGTLDWNLRNSNKVVVMERTNAMHVSLPEKCQVITVDVGWTPQIKILPNVAKNLSLNGSIISLLKPHYEAKTYGFSLQKGVFSSKNNHKLLDMVKKDISSIGLNVKNTVKSPITGKHGGNVEYLLYITF